MKDVYAAFGWATGVVLAATFAWLVFWTVRGGWRWWLAGWRNLLQLWDDARADVTPAVEVVPDEPDEPEVVEQGQVSAHLEDTTRRIDRTTFMPQPVDNFPTKAAGPKHRRPPGRIYPRRKPRTDNSGRWTP